MRNKAHTATKNDPLVKVLIVRAETKPDMDRYIRNIKQYASMENVTIIIAHQKGGDNP
jgi:hypothetical protein